MVLSHRTEPQFSQPVRQIVLMLIVLGLTAALAVLIFPTVQQIFLASPYLKIFIVIVFLFGVAACVWQVVTLIQAVNWIEGFAIDRPGHEFTQAPRLLAPLAAMLAGRQARRSLTSSSTRAVLETVATRIEEQRDLTRYIISLLIFLGLLGTFYGLATVVPAVVDTIRSLAPQEGQDAMAELRQPDEGARRPARRHGHGLRLVAARPLGVAGGRAAGTLRQPRPEPLLPRAGGVALRDHQDRHPRRRARGGADRGERARGDRPDRRAESSSLRETVEANVARVCPDRRAARCAGGTAGAARSRSRRRRSTTRS